MVPNIPIVSYIYQKNLNSGIIYMEYKYPLLELDGVCKVGPILTT